MKYVISDKGEVNIGNRYHHELAEGMQGKIISAGHCDISLGGVISVYGGSIGYSIWSKPKDAEILQKDYDTHIRTNQAVH